MLGKISLSKYDSSNVSNMLDKSINHYITQNKIGISKVTKKINFDNQYYIYDENILGKYKGLLSNYCVRVQCPKKYFYKPELLAKEIYGTADLWYLVMWFNEIPTALEFDKDVVIVFNPEKFYIINTLLSKESKSIQENNENPPLLEDLTIKKVVVKDKDL